MSDEDWQIGDLAICVSPRSMHPIIKAGWIGTVSLIVVSGTGGVGIAFYEISPIGDPAFLARRFRKIHPHSQDADDAETIALLKGKGVKSHQPA